MLETGGLSSNVAIISFADEGCEFLEIPSNIDHMKVEFDDIRPNNITKERLEELLPEAPLIASFVHQRIKEGKDIICQCDYGLSRSAGLAAAILERYGHMGIQVFQDYRYTPSQIVYNKVYDELKKL